MTFNAAFKYKLIYIFAIPDEDHKGLLKIGETTVSTDKNLEELSPNSKELNQAARERIRQYTGTAAIDFRVLHTELAVRSELNRLIAFSDKDVHAVLKRSGIKPHNFPENKGREWFKVDLETAQNAIKAVKEGRQSLQGGEIFDGMTPIVFRPEQRKAIDETKFRFEVSDHMLWNAKMRFGKTLTALQLVKECGFQKTIIITHRPVVNENWFDDFHKIFYDTDYKFGSKTQGETIEKLIEKEDTKFVYFASIQDLRGSEAAGGKYDKNIYQFLIDWDLVITDEAHEGTQTKLGQSVTNLLIDHKKKPKLLDLSGTPFNILSKYSKDEVYTWDYVMEQRAKTDWEKYHFGDNNPYAGLPKLQIYTYNLDKFLPGYIDAEDSAFNFHEFFRVWTGNPAKDFKQMPSDAKVGDFIHEKDVSRFLDLLCKSAEESNYPYSTEEFRNYFRHSLWIVPGVKEAKALSALLSKHPVFGNFERANVAGDGDEEEEYSDAMKKVRNAFGEDPSETYSITISCGRLTTGVTVPEWTAVFMLAGTFSTSASSYMQTIFRVQSPANINGKIKENCYVFDFAPDRTLKVVAETARIASRPGENNPKDEVVLGEFLNFCPIISMEGSNMKPYDVPKLMQQLKKVYTERVVKNGFDDPHIYNENLLRLDEVEIKDFEELKKIVGVSKQSKKTEEIDINDQGFTDEEYEIIKKAENKPKKERSKEELALLEEKKKKLETKQKAISILRGISIRIPLLVYGADVPSDEDITVENFASKIDPQSWQEFMPKDVTKELFKKFTKYYDKDIFVAAGKRIRQLAKAADGLPPTERVQKIAALFATFKNPDKETVLTPWRVVNMHMSECLGGYDFFDESHEDVLGEPRFVNRGEVTAETLANTKARILEINSKTGLYPLYVTYSIYRKRCEECKDALTLEKQKELWNQTIKDNVFVICKTPMAKSITKRTLAGFTNAKINAHYFEDLINQLKSKPDQFREKVIKGSYWNRGDKEMKFNAIVGNPPYQEESVKQISSKNGQTPRTNVFHYFQIAADQLSSKFVSLIYPAGRWIHRSGKGRGLAQFGLEQINDKSLEKIDFYLHAQDIFQDVDIFDGISMVLKNKGKTSDGFTYIYHENGFSFSTHLDNPGDSLMPLNPRDGLIVGKISQFVEKHKLLYLHDRILPRNLFGIESNFVESNPSEVREGSKNSIVGESEIKLFTNDRAGKAGRAKWYIANRNVIKTNQEYINEWQVVVSSANAGGQKRDNQIEIIDNHSAFGRSRVALASFKTEIEAQNFYRYANTYLIRFMFLMTDEALTSLGKKVPDIMDYTNTNKFLDFSKDLDQQLYELFDLDSDEIRFIESKVSERE
ncbi:Eco57I restriction-modification methylase domain-containing protein [bacterium]|nr:Eco57I restriction-modification methylase domain-containing protein [bacterium]